MKTHAQQREVSLCRLSIACAMALSFSATATAKDPPPVFLPGYTPAQQESNFLAFPESSVIQSPTTAAAYYDAVDPAKSKRKFTQWLVNAGFISQESDWHPTGAQIIKTGQPTGLGAYGPNIINTDSHFIGINNADLGFVRNQFIRCRPNCNAKNPIIYTYLENYAYPALTNAAELGFPTAAEATAAIQSALSTRVGRVADVAFEWAPPPGNPTSSTRYGQLYAYIFHIDSGNNLTETINWPDQPFLDSKLNSRNGDQFPPIQFNPPPAQPYTVLAGQPFAPELDFLGVKQHPGVCFMCHGGNPRNLTSSGQYPSQGRTSDFKFLPLDIGNLLFTSDSDLTDPTSRINQEGQIKRYNQMVLITQGAAPVLPAILNGKWRIPTFVDNQGAFRTTHAVEAILGWYGGSVANPSMPNPTQFSDFVPVGWREAVNGGTAPVGSEALYLKTVARSCRACHSQQQSDLDFGTVASFDSHKGDILEMVLQPECDAVNPPKGKVIMPAAARTYNRFWLENQDEPLKAHFGFTLTSYCGH